MKKFILVLILLSLGLFARVYSQIAFINTDQTVGEKITAHAVLVKKMIPVTKIIGTEVITEKNDNRWKIIDYINNPDLLSADKIMDAYMHPGYFRVRTDSSTENTSHGGFAYLVEKAKYHWWGQTYYYDPRSKTVKAQAPKYVTKESSDVNPFVTLVLIFSTAASILMIIYFFIALAYEQYENKEKAWYKNYLLTICQDLGKFLSYPLIIASMVILLIIGIVLCWQSPVGFIIIALLLVPLVALLFGWMFAII